MKVQNMEFDVVTSLRTFRREGVCITFRSKFKQVGITVQGTGIPNLRGVIPFRVKCGEFKIDEISKDGVLQFDYDGTRVTILVIYGHDALTVCFKISRALPKLNHPKVYNPVIK